MAILKKIFGNTRKPEGFFGKMMVNGMNGGSHAAMAEWGLSDFTIDGDSQALDVGCGGGANIARLLKRCHSVTGIDYSSVSVAKSSKVNSKAIEEGRCRVVEGNVADLPFGVATFDVVTAFETIYFWPDIVDSFRQVLKVLKPGGRFLIVNESDGEDPDYKKWENIVDGMHTYTAKEVESHLNAAGFASITITREPKQNWLKVVATKAF